MLSAMGSGINKCIAVAEILKRRVAGLHQWNHIQSVLLEVCMRVRESGQGGMTRDGRETFHTTGAMWGYGGNFPHHRGYVCRVKLCLPPTDGLVGLETGRKQSAHFSHDNNTLARTGHNGAKRRLGLPTAARPRASAAACEFRSGVCWSWR